MKKSTAVIVFLGLPVSTFAQQAAPVKMECRDLSTSGRVVFPNETIINGMACHVVDAKASTAQPTSAPVAKSQTAQPHLSAAPSASIPSAPAPQRADLISTRINGGSYIYIAPMDGFEIYMAAALRKKDVPLVPIDEMSKANYILKGSSEEKEKTGGWVKVASMGKIHSDAVANIRLIDRLTGAIVFSYAVEKKNTLHGQQTAAEDCAKHLKDAIDK